MKNAILTICVCFLFLSCKKDSSDSTGASKTELITKSSWKYDDAGADLDKNGGIDISATSQLQPCQTDNTLTLNSTGTGTVDEGATKCDAATPQSLPVTWNFSNNESSLVLGGGGLLGISGQFKIVTLTETALAFSKDTTYLGAPVSFLIKLKH